MQFRRVTLTLVALALALTLALPGLPALAQDDMQVLVAADGSYHFSVPADWLAFENAGTYIVANTNSAFENILNNGEAQPGDIVVVALGPTAIYDAASLDPGADASTLATALADSLASELDSTFDDPQTMPLPDGRNGIAIESSDGSSMDIAVVVIDDGSGDYLGIVFIGDSQAMEQELVFTIILSLQFGVPAGMPTPTETAEVVWAVSDVFQNLDGEMDLLPPDEVVVADGIAGFLIYSLDGQQVGTINNDAFFGASSPFVTGDGNIWVADVFNRMAYLVAPDGSIVSEFGGEDVFGSLSPDFIAVGPDGNLYVTNGTEDDRDFIQVYTPDGDFVREFQIGDADSFIWFVDMGPDGNIYVMDLGTTTNRVYSPDGDLIDDSFGQQATIMSFVTAFAALDDGTFMMGRAASEGEQDAYEILHLDADGNTIGIFRAADLGLDTIYGPLDFVQTPDGDVIVADGSADGTQLFRMHITGN